MTVKLGYVRCASLRYRLCDDSRYRLPTIEIGEEAVEWVGNCALFLKEIVDTWDRRQSEMTRGDRRGHHVVVFRSRRTLARTHSWVRPDPNDHVTNSRETPAVNSLLPRDKTAREIFGFVTKM